MNTAERSELVEYASKRALGRALSEIHDGLLECQHFTVPHEHVESQQSYIAKLQRARAAIQQIMQAPLLVLVVALATTACGDNAPAPPPADPPIERCGAEPLPADYPTLEAWRDEALLWMTCARFSCSEIVVGGQ